MLRKEWSLIVNSLLVQFAVGIFIFLAVYRVILSSSVGSGAAMRITGTGMAIAGPIVVLGMIASFFHLGNPFRAYRIVKNVTSSWLSREVVFTGAFVVLWFIYYLMEINFINNNVLIWLTAIMGILTVFSMAGIYYSTGKQGWGSMITYSSFFGSIIIFGSIGSITAIISSIESTPSMTSMLNATAILIIAVILLRLVHQFILFSKLKSEDKGRSVDSLVSGSSFSGPFILMYKTFTRWGLIFSLAGAFLIFFALMTGKIESDSLLIISSVILLLTGEVLGRSGFYSLGMPE
ncbi:MAG: DmsC/YnfH family molybdoenzyme membrane anchor subunit [Spirochaetota bacterium]